MKTPRLAFADILYLHNRIYLNIYFASVINVLTFLFLIFFKFKEEPQCFLLLVFLFSRKTISVYRIRSERLRSFQSNYCHPKVDHKDLFICLFFSKHHVSSGKGPYFSCHLTGIYS